MVDALKSLMSTMADAITRQRAIEAAGSAKPLPTLEYPLSMEGSPPTGRKGYHASAPRNMAERSHGQSEAVGFPPSGRGDLRRWNPPAGPHRRRLQDRQPLLPPMRRTPGESLGLRNKNRLLGRESGHTTIECRELKKALHELADKGQIDRFLKRGPRFLRQEQEPAPPPPRDEECSTEVVPTIAGGYMEGIARAAWKA
ncbi:hypothetical protein Cgig2_030153 [Carnegiea gigantea]|uniref:Uncharacterized protein n=1 Tax=Carnegiea gigantea TaxID=171969 RepID=A0A9Q1K149_9CARY|nr:hypothetical protein Cgig2_030153 [Carnegiea gigantea]